MTHKLLNIYTVKRFVAATITLLGLAVLATSSASAVSQTTLVLACHPNAATVAVTGGKLSCEGGSAPNESVYVAARGIDETSYPDKIALTVVSVDCGKSDIKGDISKGSDISSIGCKSGKPTIEVKKTIDASGNTVSNVKSAGTDSCGGSQCGDPAIDGCDNNNCDFVGKYVNPAITAFTAAFGIVAVISLILGGITYSTSAGDPQKVAAGKKRIVNTVIAIVAYFFLYGFLQFLIPGGLFNRSP